MSLPQKTTFARVHNALFACAAERNMSINPSGSAPSILASFSFATLFQLDCMKLSVSAPWSHVSFATFSFDARPVTQRSFLSNTRKHVMIKGARNNIFSVIGKGPVNDYALLSLPYIVIAFSTQYRSSRPYAIFLDSILLQATQLKIGSLCLMRLDVVWRPIQALSCTFYYVIRFGFLVSVVLISTVRHYGRSTLQRLSKGEVKRRDS